MNRQKFHQWLASFFIAFFAVFTPATAHSETAKTGKSGAQLIDNLDPVNNAPRKTRDADPALWMVKDKDTVVYLFGTIHALKPDSNWFDEAVKAAFDASDILVMEQAEPDQAETHKLFSQLGVDKNGKGLRAKLSDEDREKYDGAMKKLGLPVDRFDPFEPWAAAITLQILSLGKNGYSPASGAETILTSAAKQAGKPILGLETTEYQLRIFDDLPEEKQIRFLIDGSADLDEGARSMDELVQLWSSGDSEGLAKLMNGGLTESILFDRLLTQRNANWAHWISQQMEKPGTIFLAVGAGHLAGTTSVQHMLTAYGLQAQRIDY